MAYICNHGVFYMNCPICSEYEEILEARRREELDWADQNYMEYLYDKFLDRDEKALRDEQ